MTNTYRKYLDQFFEKLLYYRHISGRINKVFQKDIYTYTSEQAKIHFISALIISDWTGPTDNGWEINFHSGGSIETTKSNYESEIRKIFSKQLCLLYAQSFESFERYLKDCLFMIIGRDDKIKEYLINLLPKTQKLPITRERMPGGEILFKVLKKAGGKSYHNFSSENNLNINFKELWTILSQVRHSITHNESALNLGLVYKSERHTEIFNFLFNSNLISEDFTSIELDYKKFERLVKRFSEFAYQIFKILSVEEGLELKKIDK